MDELVNNCAVKIAVRERPFRRSSAVHENEKTSVISYPAPELNSNTLIVDERPFTFDHVLGPTVEQHQLYEVLIRPLVAKVKQGYNCTAMAYGQTGTGKSFTMGLNLNNFEGTHVGVIPRCLAEILNADETNEAIAENCVQRDFHASFIEIYNEKIYDLLAANPMEPVTARDYKQAGSTRASLTSLDDCYRILSCGNKNRHVRPTKMNSQSSRSHAIFTVHVRSTKQSADSEAFVTNAACLNLVDLAGSEGVRRTGHSGVAMSEGVHINQGLLCIGKVLQAMVLGNKVIPYRDSVLSSVLQDSLSPNSFLTLLACISPCREDLSETLNTLRFAQNAKHLRHAPIINKMVAEIKKNRLKTPHQIKPLNSRNGPTPDNRAFSSVTKSIPRRHPATPASHRNTFSTPNKIKPIEANKFNHTEIGMTPREKQKAQQKGMARSTLHNPKTSAAAPAYPPFDFHNTNRESLFDHTIESRSSIMSFNISTSTAVDAPVTTNKPFSFSPVVRQCVAEMQTVMENKMQQMFETLKTMNSREVAGLQTPITPAPQELSTMQIFPGSIRQELKIMMQELMASNVAAQELKSNISNESPITELPPFATSSPVFKVPEVPKFTVRKGNLNFDSSLESNPDTSNPNVSQEKEPTATSSPVFKIPEVPKINARKGNLSFDSSLDISNLNVSQQKEQKSTCNAQQFFSFSEQTAIHKQPPPPSSKRRCSMRLAERSAGHTETLDGSGGNGSTASSQRRRSTRKSLKQVHDARRRSIRQQSLKPIVEAEVQPQQLPTSRKKKATKSPVATVLLDNSVIAHYMDGPNADTKSSKSISIAKHRKAILNLLNTGSMKDLQMLPQVGPKTAYQIVTQRVLNGKFKNIRQVEMLPIWRGNSWERFAQANILQ